MRFIGIFPEVPEVGIRGQRSAPQDFLGCPSSLEMSGFLPPRLTTVRANLDVMVTCLAVALLFSKMVLATHSVCLYTAPEPTPVSDLVSPDARSHDSYRLTASESLSTGIEPSSESWRTNLAMRRLSASHLRSHVQTFV